MLKQPELLAFDIPATEHAPAYRLNCWQWGETNAGRTLLCMHGLTRNGRDFDFLAGALSTRYHVLCPDMPGRGQSPWLDARHYHYATYVAATQHLLNTLAVSKVDWIGTSMGGIIGMMMPARINRLVMNDIGRTVSAAGLKRILSYAGKAMRFSSRAEAEAALRQICAPFGITDERHWQHLFNHSITETADGARFSYDPVIISNLTAQEEIKDIDLSAAWETTKAIPTLLIRGEQSDILSAETAQTMKTEHTNLTLYEVANAGHAPALMSDDQITVILNWLASS